MGHLSLRVPDSSLTLLAKGCGSCPTNLHTLLSIESKSLNVVVRLSRERMTTGIQRRLQEGKVDRPRLPARPTAWQPLTAASDCDLLPHSPEVARTLLSRRLCTNCQQLDCFHLKAESNQNMMFVPLKDFVSHTF